jgi:hypothetical protein
MILHYYIKSRLYRIFLYMPSTKQLQSCGFTSGCSHRFTPLLCVQNPSTPFLQSPAAAAIYGEGDLLHRQRGAAPELLQRAQRHPLRHGQAPLSSSASTPPSSRSPPSASPARSGRPPPNPSSAPTTPTLPRLLFPRAPAASAETAGEAAARVAGG